MSIPDGRRAPRDLGHHASRGVMVTLTGLWSRTLIQMGSTVVLARLLSPDDFGLVAMVTAIVGLADLVRDFGMTGAIIQARALSERLWRSVLWFSVALGVALMAVVAACAPLIAELYGHEQLILITVLISPTLLVNALAMPLQARVTRELRFGLLARLDVLSMLAGAVLAIATALAGGGVWALLVLNGAAQIVRLVGLWIAARPSFGPPRISREVLPLLGTGGSIFGAELLNYAERNLDNVIIGQQLGPDALGQYSRAYALFLLPLQQLNGPLGRVALPVLSTLRDDGPRYRRYIRSAVMVSGYTTLPAYAIAAAVASPLIALLLGPGWEQAAVLFALLAIAGAAQALGKVRSWLYITLGRSHRQFAYDLFARPVVIAGYFAGIFWAGVEGLALVYGVLTVILLVPGFWFAIRGTFVRGSDVIVPVLRPAVLAGLAFGAATTATAAVALPPALELLVGVAAGALPFALALLVPAYRRDYGTILDFVRRTRRRTAVPAPPETDPPDAV